ncbi:hypothetical protein [Actinomadura sp. 9N215]|uniref:hypothetical protein n=1 Tax=Actinomadura sp. 9N215 TaxID=3375150 RepID=UPI0037A00CFB
MPSARVHRPGRTSLLDTYKPERRAAADAALARSRGMHEAYQSSRGDPNDLYEKIAVG